MQKMVAIMIWSIGILFIGWSPKSSLEIKEEAEGYWVYEGRKKVLFYQKTPKSLDGKYARNHYIHPLYSLDGVILTEDFPEDHLHHRGIFWAWHQIWIGEERIGDGWVLEDISWHVENVEVLQPDNESLALKIQVFWQSPRWTNADGSEKPFIDEIAAIRIYREHQNMRILDFEIGLLALEERLKIGGSEDEKGYGGFSPRIKLPDDLMFIGKDGQVKPMNTQVSAGPWLDMTGTFDDEGRRSGVAVFCHPSSPNFPQPWILRQTSSMQNVVYPGRDAVLLSTEKRLFLRYRMILHRDGPEDIDLNKYFEQYGNDTPFLLF